MIYDCPIVKAKATIPVDSDQLPPDVYEEVFRLGMKELVNRKMSKETKKAHNGDEAKLRASAFAIAESNLKDIYEGKIRYMAGSKPKKASGAVMTEAMRIARNLVKDELKRMKVKISDVDAKEITALAKDLIEDDDNIVKMAEANIAEREEKAKGNSKLSAIVGKVKVNADKVAKREAEKSTLSAAKAGQTNQRSRKGRPTPTRPEATA